MERIIKSTHIEVIGQDMNGRFKIEILNDCSQFYLEADDESTYINTTAEELLFLRDAITDIVRDRYAELNVSEVATKSLAFGSAIEAMKKGHKVARAGWNGKGMWLRHVEPYNDMGITDSQVDKVTDATLLPWIGMKTADNKFVPWLASQTDILSEDWEIVL